MIDWLQQRPLLRFTLTVVALLPPCFVVWYFLGNFIAAPAVFIVEPLLQNWLGDSVINISLRETGLVIVSSYGEAEGQIVSAAEAGNRLAFPIDTRTLSYSIPFFTALHLATPMRGSWEKFSVCLLALWSLLALGLVFTALKDLMVGLGPVFMARDWLPPGELIAVIYQLSSLMVPPLAPVILWAYVAKDSPTFRALLPESLRTARDATTES